MGSSSRTPWRGDLPFRIECLASPTAVAGPRHPVVIHDDWSVGTPHDLEAERVAVGLGGYYSCLELVDRTLPRLRGRLDRITRTGRARPRRYTDRHWRAPDDERMPCCRATTFSSVRRVAEHLRSPRHLAALLDAPAWQLETLVRAIAAACRPELGDSAPESRFVREARGLEDLWQAGIHPREVPGMAGWVSASVMEPLPVTYFEGIAYSGQAADWLAEVVAARPDADTAAWLAWLPRPASSGVRRAAARWLGFGLRREDFLSALDHGVDPAEVPDAARATGWSEHRTARAVVAWARADCRPTPEQLGVVARLGVDAVPGLGALQRASDDVRELGVTIGWTQLGVMIAVAGNRPTLLAAVRDGVRSLDDLVDRIGHAAP